MALSDMKPNESLALIEEAITCVNLLKYGIDTLEKAEKDDTQLYLMFFLLSSGFERLIKLCLIFIYLKENSKLPEEELWERGYGKGHDISLLLKIFLENVDLNKNELCEPEIKFIKENELLRKLLEPLSYFGKQGRYYNINTLTKQENPGNSPKELWEGIEMEIALANFEHGAEDQIREITKAGEISFRRIKETIQITIGVFSRLIVTGALGIEAKQLTAFFIDYISWTKPLLPTTL